MKTPVTMTIRLTEQIVARNILLQQPLHIVRLLRDWRLEPGQLLSVTSRVGHSALETCVITDSAAQTNPGKQLSVLRQCVGSV